MKNILEAIEKAGGKALFIGGCVRDGIMGVESKDIDVEVYGLEADKLCLVLKKFGRVDMVGVSFGVVKLTTADTDYDFTLPRRDNKVGDKHTDFDVVVDHMLTPAEAALRRDYTMNSVGRDAEGNIIDPYNGVADIASRTLRATSGHFTEDALRVLRGMQFAGRFNMSVDIHTAIMCGIMIDGYSNLSTERIFGEWIKWAEKSIKPSMGLRFLVATGWIKLYPELDKLRFCDQDSEWHPEGNVFEHVSQVVDQAAMIASRENLSRENRVILMFAALCHDLGKVGTTAIINGRIRSPKHDKTGVPLTRSFMESIGFVGDSKLCKIVDKVCNLVSEHMAHCGAKPSDRTVRRLSVRLGGVSIKMLSYLVEADHTGRKPLVSTPSANMAAIVRTAERLEVIDSKPKPLFGGRDLIEMGLEPSPEFKTILDKAYELQLDGVDFNLTNLV